MARVSGTALSNFLNFTLKMGGPSWSAAVRGVGKELVEQGAGHRLLKI